MVRGPDVPKQVGGVSEDLVAARPGALVHARHVLVALAALPVAILRIHIIVAAIFRVFLVPLRTSRVHHCIDISSGQPFRRPFLLQFPDFKRGALRQRRFGAHGANEARALGARIRHLPILQADQVIHVPAALVVAQ